MVDKSNRPDDPFEKTIVQLRQVTENAPSPTTGETSDTPPPGNPDMNDGQSIDFDLNIPVPPPVDLALVDKDPVQVVVDRRQGKVIEEQHRHELEIEDRKFRNWIMKTLVMCFCVVVVLIVGGMIYSTYVKGNTNTDSTLKAFLEAVTEILKVLKPGGEGE